MPLGIGRVLDIMLGRTNDPLLRNSMFLMLYSVANAGLGFVFWFAAAKLSAPDDLGLAIGIVSSLSLIVLITRFGLDLALIRFFPDGDKARVFGTALSVTTISTLICSLIYIGGIGLFSPSLSFLSEPVNFLLFVGFATAGSVFWLIGSAFLALRRADNYFYQTSMSGSKILFLLPLAAFGAIGIFVSFGIAMVISMAIFLVVLVKLGVRIDLSIDVAFLKKSFAFCSSNYVSQLLIWAPTLILPIFVLNALSAPDAASYYIAYTIASILFMIPNAVSTSLFVEGSHGQDMKLETRRSYKTTFMVLTPLTIIFIIFGNSVLGLFGATYSDIAFDVLRIMLLSGFFVAIVQICMSILRVRDANREIVILSAWIFFSLIITSAILVSIIGLNGIGYAWLLSYGAGSLLSLIMIRKKRQGDKSDKIKSPIVV